MTAKLNSGLVRLVSVRNYPPAQKPKFAGEKKLRRGAVFRVGALHRKPLTEEVLRRNRRGYVNAQVNTVAHAPSLYHWLFHRCGIPFEETQMLIKTGGLRMNGALVQRLDEAEVQLPWSDWQKLIIEVRTSNPLAVQALQHSSSPSSFDSFPHEEGKEKDDGGRKWHSEDQEESAQEEKREGFDAAEQKESSERQGKDLVKEEGVFVLALQRALHRRYLFQYLHPSLSISSDVADPRSFVHRLTPVFFRTSSEALGLNHLHPMGVIAGIRGLGIASTDASMIRYWNNACLGNYGVYDVRFAAGTPCEVMDGARKRLMAALQASVMSQLPEALLGSGEGSASSQELSTLSTSITSAGTIPPCQCTLEPVPPSSRDWVGSQLVLSSSSPFPSLGQQQEKRNKRGNHREFSKDARLLVNTPLFPYREVKHLWRLGAVITLTRSGPFSLPEDLAHIQHRLLTVEELALLFAFERKLKVNRMILSLREFEADE